MPVRLYQNNQQPAITPIEASDLISQAPLYADSIEVVKAYYKDKLQELGNQLNCLTIEEHPRQITLLAKQVLSVLAILKSLSE